MWTRIDDSDGPLRPRSLLVAEIGALTSPSVPLRRLGRLPERRARGLSAHRGSCCPAPADSCHVACLVMGQKSKMDLQEDRQVFKSQLVQ